jgi:hypothetical protein
LRIWVSIYSTRKKTTIRKKCVPLITGEKLKIHALLCSAFTYFAVNSTTSLRRWANIVSSRMCMSAMWSRNLNCLSVEGRYFKTTKVCSGLLLQYKLSHLEWCRDLSFLSVDFEDSFFKLD